MKMNRIAVALLVLVLGALKLQSAFGQSGIYFENGTFTDSTVLALAGNPLQEVYGISWGNSSAAATANGYAFDATTSANASYDVSGNYTTFLSGGGSSGDTAFNAVLNHGRVGSGTGTLVLKNLAQGVTYRALFLLADTRSGMGARTFSVTQDGDTSPSQQYAYVAGSPAIGGYVLCTFTATGMTETFTVNLSPGRQLNAVLLCCEGANMPFKTIEGEWGALGGSAGVVSLAAGALPTQHSEPLEASGRAYVHLAATGDSVTCANNTSMTANAIVIRACIPDAPAGGGITATLDMYVNGVFRQAIPLTSAYSWIYDSGWQDDVPGAGKNPQRFFDEARAQITGAAIAPGSTVTFKKDAANTAAFYDVDCFELESVGAAKTQPANTLSVVAYGATPNDTTDDSAAIQSCINAAQTQGKGVWIPAGTFYTSQMISATGITISGAGVWYTTLYRNPPTNTVNGVRTKLNLSDCTVRDLYIDGNAIGRHIPQGADYGMTMVGTTGWLVERVWVHNTAPAFWMSGTNGTVQNCRTANTWADGINLNNTPNADGLGTNLTVQNCFFRGSCDDAIAINAQNGLGTAGNMVNTKVLNNTSAAATGANGLRIAGGRGSLIQNNLIQDPTEIEGIVASTFGTAGNPLESATLSGNFLVRAPGYKSSHAGIFVTAGSTGVVVTRNIVVDSLKAGLAMQNTTGAVFTRNVIDSPEKQGFWIIPSATGSATFQFNVVDGLLAGQSAFENDSPSTFTVTSSGNTGF